jgi:hypothetical protein
MTSITTTTGPVTGGVDTHSETHHVAVLDQVSRELGDREFPTNPSGYRALLGWLAGHGQLDRVGVEGTGAYGAALARHLRAGGVTVVEVDRPDRKARGTVASPTHWMLTLPRVPRCREQRPGKTRAVTEESRQSGRCGSLAAVRSKPGPQLPTSSSRYWSLGRPSDVSSYGT